MWARWGVLASCSFKAARVLLPIFIEATDDHGAATVIEPALNVVAHVGGPVDPGMLVMRDTDVLPLRVSDQICGAFQGLHLTDH